MALNSDADQQDRPDLTVGAWFHSMPRWKQILFTVCTFTPYLDFFMINAFGYHRWQRRQQEK